MKRTEIHWTNNILVRNWVGEGMPNKKKNSIPLNIQKRQVEKFDGDKIKSTQI